MSDQAPSNEEVFNATKQEVDGTFNMGLGLVVAIIVIGIILTIIFYYFMYKQYSSGQNHCSVLYPGNTLKDLRLRDECKDRKRRNWSMPAAAMLIN
jgi:hypothetical protein